MVLQQMQLLFQTLQLQLLFNRLTILDTIVVGKPTVLGAISGGIAGLVAITQQQDLLMFLSISIGAVAPLVSYFCNLLLKSKKNLVTMMH